MLFFLKKSASFTVSLDLYPKLAGIIKILTFAACLNFEEY